MTHLLATYGLLDHVEGRVTAPSKTIAKANSVTTLNLDYLKWESRDNFALTYVMQTTEPFGVTILTAKTSYEAWTSLATLFFNQTTAQEDLLNQQWRDLKKGSQSMPTFINSVKEQALRYSQIGKPKTTTEINQRFYTSLDSEWEPIVFAQSKRMLTISTEELQLLLVGHEEYRFYTAIHEARFSTPTAGMETIKVADTRAKAREERGTTREESRGGSSGRGSGSENSNLGSGGEGNSSSLGFLNLGRD
ncbi:hypothetical protein CRG98_007725 [Punica granatum]|uniref:Uncharacterized protein n=1 Tax=Punica granatum TaxID=22663 RepID=A0A2I0KVJ3_PUNGR|nr:hypothetical protein CRG98_007725 [Punica granatum]